MDNGIQRAEPGAPGRTVDQRAKGKRARLKKKAGPARREILARLHTRAPAGKLALWSSQIDNHIAFAVLHATFELLLPPAWFAGACWSAQCPFFHAPSSFLV